jgi:hypothetical protein
MSCEKARNGAKIAVVAFVDAERPRWLRLLAKGFRHCFALVRSSGRWVVINPMSHWTDVVALAETADGASADEMVRALEERGLAAVACTVEEPARRAVPFAPFTCVEVVKRILGITEPLVLTPWQLFRFLEQNQDIEKNRTKMKIILDKGKNAC